MPVGLTKAQIAILPTFKRFLANGTEDEKTDKEQSAENMKCMVCMEHFDD